MHISAKFDDIACPIGSKSFAARKIISPIITKIKMDEASLKTVHDDLQTALQRRDRERMLSILGRLLDELSLTKEQITASKLGSLVNNLRKAVGGDDTECRDVAERVLLKWKPIMLSLASNSAVDDAKDGNSLPPSPVLDGAPVKRGPSEDPSPKEKEAKRTRASGAEESKDDGRVMEEEHQPMSIKYASKEEYNQALEAFLPSGDVRSKTFLMFLKALMVDLVDDGKDEEGRKRKDLHALPDELTLETAHAIEACLYHQHQEQVSTEYKQAVRTKYLNLSSKLGGRHLRLALLDGALKPTRFAAMASSVSSIIVCAYVDVIMGA
jgi:hypothetical protein